MENKRRIDGDETMREDTAVLIKPIAVHMSEEIQSTECLLGTLHSVFETVENYMVNIAGEQRMITIMQEGNYLLPDSVILSRQDYCILKKRKGKTIHIENSAMWFSNFRIDLSKSVSLNLLECSYDKFRKDYYEKEISNIQIFLEKNEKKSDLERLPVKYKTGITQFVKGIITNSPDLTEKSFREFIGAGRGLTPAADDAMIGALAGSLLYLVINEEQHYYYNCIKKILTQLCSEKLTTEVSTKYLKCACQGNFSLLMCQLIDALVGKRKKDLEELLTSIASIGHTSGMDMLYGFMISNKITSLSRSI